MLAPGLVFGCFYALVTPFHLSQVEWLVGAPLAVILWCVRGEERPGSGAVVGRSFLIGLMLAVVVLFKLMLGGVALAMLAVALVLDLREGAVTWRSLFRQRLLPALAGCGLVLLPVIAWMAAHDTLTKAVWTTFVYPGQALREYQRQSVHMLMDSLGWFLSEYGCSCHGLAGGVRRPAAGLTAGAAVCNLVRDGFFDRLAQLLSYWTYHFDLFFIPVGILAALDFVMRWNAPPLAAVRASRVALVAGNGAGGCRVDRMACAAQGGTCGRG